MPEPEQGPASSAVDVAEVALTLLPGATYDHTGFGRAGTVASASSVGAQGALAPPPASFAPNTRMPPAQMQVSPVAASTAHRQQEQQRRHQQQQQQVLLQGQTTLQHNTKHGSVGAVAALQSPVFAAHTTVESLRPVPGGLGSVTMRGPHLGHRLAHEFPPVLHPLAAGC